MNKVLLAAIGATMLLMCSWHVTLRDCRFRARGDRLIKRGSHPVMFWLNFGGLVIVCILGVVSIAWEMI
jgi:hypothetical protein